MPRLSQRQRQQPQRLQLDGPRIRHEYVNEIRDNARAQRQAEIQENRHHAQQRARLGAQEGQEENEEDRLEQEALVAAVDLERLRNEHNEWQSFCKGFRCLEETLRCNIVKKFSYFLVSFSFRCPTDLSLGLYSGVRDLQEWNVHFTRTILPLFQTPPAWSNQPEEILEVVTHPSIRRVMDPYIFRLKISFANNEGHRYLMQHFNRSAITDNLLTKIAEFLDPAWARLDSQFVAGTILSQLKRIFLSLDLLKLYCSRCNILFQETGLKTHVAEHHRDLFEDDYSPFICREDENTRLLQIINYSPMGRILKDHALRNADFWLNAAMMDIQCRDRDNNDLGRLHWVTAEAIEEGN
jgi:hypothetical protein